MFARVHDVSKPVRRPSRSVGNHADLYMPYKVCRNAVELGTRSRQRGLLLVAAVSSLLHAAVATAASSANIFRVPAFSLAPI